ncbi:MAG TPA: YggT family protein [Sphaerochaeta sp.]|jgi:YggT family protein|nr:YggT family protein [Spirochaetota bacterium]NLV61697.1 YggT family protein [Spirochaetales bacterium]HOE84913.1 YggT family protein [Sphaerochaeta sp.]HOQ94231.1 YggT family protein [Sphaerochaeta sp.]HPK47069.1 YggT family protein [Sphaerochaeta sp.]
MHYTTYPTIAQTSGGSTFFMTLASILASLLSFYSLLIWLRIVITWIRIPQNPLSHALAKIVDPYLDLFKSITALKRERFDLTPLAALAALSVVQSMLRLYGSYGTITLGMVLALLLQTLWSYLASPIFWFLLILLSVRLYFCYRPSPQTISYIAMLDSLVGFLLNWVQRLFYPGKSVNDRRLVTTTLIFVLVLYLTSSALIKALVTLVSRLGF